MAGDPRDLSLEPTPVRLFRGRWAGFELTTTDGDATDWLMWVGLRDAFDRAPTLAIVWNRPDDQQD